MPIVIKCRACQAIIWSDPEPFTKLPKKCPVCPCSVFYVLCADDVERERLRALDRSGCLISSLLDNKR